MLFKKVLLALAVSSLAEVAIAQDQQQEQQQGQQQGQQQDQQQNNNAGATGTGGAGGNNGAAATLNADALQTGSGLTGQQNGASGIKAGQAPSQTDTANFINFCSGKTLTNGKQVKTGSCNGIPMGDIPATTNMVSTIITNPGPGDDLPANQDFNVQFQVANLKAGVFTNPDETYYIAPQALDPQSNNIIGHVHVTIQTLGDNLAPKAAPDATTFVFFKGVDDDGDGNGGLQATVAGGLPAGSYRVCTMSAAANHQPVNMPVAQRGAQDDCTKFTVGAGNGGGANGGNAANANGGNANGGNANGGNAANGGATGSGTDAAAATASTTAAANGQQGGQQQGGQQQGGQQQGGAVASGTDAATGATQTTAAVGGQQGGQQQGGQQAATTQAAQGTQTSAAVNGQQGGQQQGGQQQGGQQASTTQAAQAAQGTDQAQANAQAGGNNQFGGFGNFGGRRRQSQWGPRHHRFQGRPYVV
ncbi:hypothetical protein G7Y79_00003g010620 [Physcia stellaris]|nr:hypothetical protein G7Y79_00003g010620 [Physcia stellaris]